MTDEISFSHAIYKLNLYIIILLLLLIIIIITIASIYSFGSLLSLMYYQFDGLVVKNCDFYHHLFGINLNKS